ncbi:hypothetical protein CLV84_0301 [Neolewinella xylanilytica]|uniref:Protease inhibitor Inh n=1 Tax=Neolewinella xylanilytica TaxID=1514080 RepID=A0A2S6I780_9BACT|nr:hypothetical protein [Neolewinella xylanilytica]PPK87361.1 hypothetical protein CLV84_0301 [Neolewinella xylanilytica]
MLLRCAVAGCFLLVACTSQPAGPAPETSGADRLDAAQGLLQGKWKRQSYPYGTIEFGEQRVKFTTGEGLAEPPAFVAWELVDACPDATAVGVPPTEYDFVLVHGNENCDAIKLSVDEFTIYYAGSEEGVIYVRE